MSGQIDWTAGDEPQKPKRRRGGARRRGGVPGGGGQAAGPAEEHVDSAVQAAGAGEALPGAGDVAPEPEETPPEGAAADPLAFPESAQLQKRGLRVLPVVTGAVVDGAGNFLFYVDGHDDARAGVQAQLNHLLGSGPSREEHLAPARARAEHLAKKLRKPR